MGPTSSIPEVVTRSIVWRDFQESTRSLPGTSLESMHSIWAFVPRKWIDQNVSFQVGRCLPGMNPLDSRPLHSKKQRTSSPTSLRMIQTGESLMTLRRMASKGPKVGSTSPSAMPFWNIPERRRHSEKRINGFDKLRWNMSGLKAFWGISHYIYWLLQGQRRAVLHLMPGLWVGTYPTQSTSLSPHYHAKVIIQTIGSLQKNHLEHFSINIYLRTLQRRQQFSIKYED